MRLGQTFNVSFMKQSLLSTIAVAIASIVIVGSGGSIVVISTNQVSAPYRTLTLGATQRLRKHMDYNLDSFPEFRHPSQFIR